VQKWLTGHWRESFTELLRDSLAEKEGWINVRPALDLLENSVKKNWAPRQLWFIFVLESWLRFEKNLPTQ
jgi:hypothetical protein